MRDFLIIFLTTFIVSSSNGQTVYTDKVSPYGYDTTLKGGYSLSFKVDDSLQYLYLRKRGKIVTELSSTSRGLPYKNLGYIGADFKDYFVLVHSFGGGNPHYIDLIKKRTGKNIFKNAPAWIGADERKEFLLYSDNDVPDKDDKMTLLNVSTGQRKYFKFPSDIFDGPQVLNRIRITRLTDKQLVVEYDTEKGTKTKMYSR